MMDINQKRIILEEILKSDSFINSKLNTKLLTYLVECEIEGKEPSEFSIAADVFQKDSSFNPNEDTLVRVSVYNLRKKLERYYLNMGKNDKIRVKIPKGHYEVKFFDYRKEKVRDKLNNPYLILGPIIIILIGFIIYLLASMPDEDNSVRTLKEKSFAGYIFSDFVDSENPKIVALGDDFIYFSDFSEFNTTPVRRMYRNSEINTEEEFERYKSEDESKGNLKMLPFSFFNQAAVWPLPYLVNLLNGFNAEYTLRSSTSLNSNDLKANDIMFIGSFWTLGILKKVIDDLGFNYKIIGREELRVQTDDSTVVFRRSGIPAFDHIDFSTLMKIPGPENNTIYLLASFYATGSVGLARYLTTEESLDKLKEKFEEEFNDLPKYFLVVFKSKGYNREVLSTEMLYVKQIQPSEIKW